MVASIHHLRTMNSHGSSLHHPRPKHRQSSFDDAVISDAMAGVAERVRVRRASVEYDHRRQQQHQQEQEQERSASMPNIKPPASGRFLGGPLSPSLERPTRRPDDLTVGRLTSRRNLYSDDQDEAPTANNHTIEEALDSSEHSFGRSFGRGLDHSGGSRGRSRLSNKLDSSGGRRLSNDRRDRNQSRLLVQNKAASSRGGNTFKRRMTFDIMNPSAGGGLDGMFGGLRRLSLDHERTAAHEETPRDTAAVTNFKEVFQQMKQENPSAPIGALHQKTMTRIAELKCIREMEEQREREEQARQEEEERLRKQSLAKKAVDKWMSKMRHTQTTNNVSLNPAHDQGSHDSSEAKNMIYQPALVKVNNSTLPSQEGGDGIFAHQIPLGSRASMMQASAALMSRRRISVDTNGSRSRRASVDSDAITSQDEIVTYSTALGAGLVLGGDDQKMNMAPRKSITSGTDDASYFSNMDDKSVQSFLSEVSKLSELLLDPSECDISRASCDFSREDDVVREGETHLVEVASDSGTRKSFGRNRKPSYQDLMDTLSTAARSECSDFTADYSRAGSNGGLIVGFVNRRRGGSEDGLIVGFGDRSGRSRHSTKD